MHFCVVFPPPVVGFSMNLESTVNDVAEVLIPTACGTLEAYKNVDG